MAFSVRKNKVTIERSCPDFVFHNLITCGKNDIDEINAPEYPMICSIIINIFRINLKDIKNKTKLKR